jgi:two-component system chemotaxis sensor kinase CheA
LDLAKFQALFLEEAGEHLAEMGRALLELEKDATSKDAIDRVFRMAHSVKGMAASLGYQAITELAHRLEDRMAACRAAGRLEPAELEALLRDLEALERMVEAVRRGEEPAPVGGGLAAGGAEGPPEKKAPRRP